MPVFNVTTLEAHSSFALLPIRAAATTLGVVGLVALVLAASGIFGVVAFAVSQRTKEIGVRLAIGAAPTTVLRLVMRGGLGLTLTGLVIGLGAAVFSTRFLAFLLCGLDPLDPLTLAEVAPFMTGVALVACYLLARRAIRGDPLVALRHD